MGAGPGRIDMVVSDPEGRHDFEPRQARHQSGIDTIGHRADRDGAQPRRERGQGGFGIAPGQPMNGESGRQAIEHDRLRRSQQQDIGFLVGHESLSK
jgi:hypothetical protein